MDTPRPLNPDEVRYLVLEGGGGKGFAYVGALGVLEDLKVMNHIDGFAGASAGAITALLLSIGYSHQDLDAYLLHTDFDEFFDPPTTRAVPIAGRGVCRLVSDNDAERELLSRLELLPEGNDVLSTLDALLSSGESAFQMLRSGAKALVLPQPFGVIGMLLAALQHDDPSRLTRAIGAKKDRPPFSVLLRHWKKYAAYLGRDMGLFAGCAARRQFDLLLSQRIPSAGAEPFRDVTFAEHYRFFKKELLVTGSNLTTGRTELFSRQTTPAFPVADAVRISMSLPFIYKPYVITKQMRGWPPCGTYVDGGLWNNLPFREFDGHAPPAQSNPESAALRDSSGASAATANGAAPVRRTLGLRLEITPASSITDMGEFVAKSANFALFGTGETQVLSKYVAQMILLDTRGLDLIDFKPDPADVARAIKRARRATWRYFERPVPPEDADPEDDAKTRELLAKDRACSG